MAHPVIWPKKTFFYPVGNTPPVCLTQGLSPEENADILLLGCGDPRSILYTVYADLADGNRSMDLTCCDWEPAVLARNILLLTMIVDGVTTDAAWSIFYHFFLDESSHNILAAQCRTLLQSSPDMKMWKDSKYGKFIRFCTDYSLSEIRRHWSLYAKSKDLSMAEHKAWKESFYSEMKSIRDNLGGERLTTLRAAGPLFMSILGKGLGSYSSFWTTGVTKSKAARAVPTPYVNPTFSYSLSGKNFNVHYSTDPIAAFFLAPMLAHSKVGKPASSVTLEDLVDAAKSQFSSWCQSFKTRLSSASTANLVVRFFVGESLAFCQALHICKEQQTTETTIYAHPWGGAPIVLDVDDYGASSATPAPLLFNVIETSNLADHAGLLNLLVVTVPLLDRKPWSMLYTNTLLRSDPQGPAKSGLVQSAFADIPTLSMMLGIAPSPHLWHFTTHSNKHEIITSTPTSGQLLESISWRFIVPSIAPNMISNQQDTEIGRFIFLCDADKLAKFFFSVYLRMFADENQMMNMRNISAGNMSSYTKQNVIHYIRASFVAFLAFVKGSIRVDWKTTMNHLIDLIGADRSFLMGMNNYQDVMCQMYLRKLNSLNVLTSAYVETVRTSRDRFQGWTTVPPIVCIVLKVPRKELKGLEDMDPDKILTPILQCEMYGARFHNIHSSIQLVFGDTQVSVVDGEPQVAIKEDPKGWNGNSALIASFYLPSWILTTEPMSTQVGLNIRSTPMSIKLIPLLGMRLSIFSASLTDTAHVHVVRHRPNNPQEVEYLRDTPAFSTPTASESVRDVMVKFNPSGEKATHLIIRKDVTDPAAARLLTSGSEVKVTPIADASVLVTFGGHSLRFIYPFPIQTKRLQTRIARKSAYIEIEAPIRPDFIDSGDLSLNPFAVAHNERTLSLLNVHYLNLDILPVLSLPGKEKDLQWLSVHAGMMFSHAEKEAKGQPDLGERGTLANLKESIGCIILNYAGLQLQTPSAWSSIFGLNSPRHGGVYTLIFVNAMKFDLASHTVVVDACVVPLVESIMPKLGPALQALTERRFIQVVTHEDEKRAWKLLLPVVAERCRTWKHTDACEYRTRGVPVAIEGSEQSPLCGCGKGKNLGQFGTLSQWKLFHGEATRVAISPLFTFSFLEEISKSIATSMAGAAADLGLPKSDRCAKCGGPGKPTLRSCSACKDAQYCSRECQRAHWKVHKKTCIGSK